MGIGGGASNLDLRSISIIEVELGIDILHNFTREELGLTGEPIERNVNRGKK